MKNSDRKKFKEILDWVARNFKKKKLERFEYNDVWEDLNAYPIETIECAADHIRTYNQFFPTKADWMNAIRASHKPEPYKALPEPKKSDISKIWAHLHCQVLGRFVPIPDNELTGWMRSYLADANMPQGLIDQVWPEDGRITT